MFNELILIFMNCEICTNSNPCEKKDNFAALKQFDKYNTPKNMIRIFLF